MPENHDAGFSSTLYGRSAGGEGDRQTSSLKLRCNPPETIPEEEIERIRRESLVPHVGLLAGDGRRKSSTVGLDGSTSSGGNTINGKLSAPKYSGKADGGVGNLNKAAKQAGGRRSSSAVFSGGFKGAVKLLPKSLGNAAMLPDASTNSNNLMATVSSPASGNTTKSPIFSDDIITLMTEESTLSQERLQAEEEGRAASEASSCYSQRRDEGLGESFDRYSEVSGYGNGSGCGGVGETLIELHTLNAHTGSGKAKQPSPASSNSSLTGPTNNSVLGQSIPGLGMDSTVVPAYSARPSYSPKTKNNNISKRKVSSSSSAPCESRRKKSDDVSPDGEKAFVSVSRSLPLGSSQEIADDSEHESSGGENGIDPLFFLSELQSKRVTFM